MTLGEGRGLTEHSTSLSSFADALGRAIAERKITLASLQERLTVQGVSVSVATLSYWRSGARRPDGDHSVVTVEAIEIVLELEPNSLTSLMIPAHRLGRLAEPGPVYRGSAQQAVNEVMGKLEAKPAAAVREVASQMRVDVGRSGHVERNTTRYLVQATTDVLTELPVFDSSQVPLEAIPVVTSVVGAEIVKEHVHQSRMAWGFVAQLDEPLLRGETSFVEVVEEYPPGLAGVRVASHGSTRISKEVLIWVCFHSDAVPNWCVATYESSIENTRSERHELRIVGGRAHVVRHNFGPGVLRVSWGYDTEQLKAPGSAELRSPEE